MDVAQYGIRFSPQGTAAAMRQGDDSPGLGPSINSLAADQALASRVDERCIRSDERERIARELHDSTSQLLVALELQLMRLKHSSEVTRSSLFDDVMSELTATIKELHEEVRAIARTNEIGKIAFRDELSAMAEEFGRRTEVTIGISAEALPELPRKVAAAFYRIAQEAVANAVRHGKARKIDVSVRARGQKITLRIADDGSGFGEAVAERFDGLGISNMRARMDQAGGDLVIRNLKSGALVEAKLDLATCMAVD